MSMYCYQCQETARNEACTRRGVCGKTAEVATLQDLLIWTMKGLSVVNEKALELGFQSLQANTLVAEGLFATITNANFDETRFVEMIDEVVAERDALVERITAVDADWVASLPQAATWRPMLRTMEELQTTGSVVGVMADAPQGEDIQSLRQLLTLGLKGMAAYLDHASVLGYRDEELFAFLQEGLAATLDDSLTVDDLVGLVLKCGSKGVDTMALLDKANTETFGNPEITSVSLGVKDGPGILVSGHDLLDLKELLEQTEGTGVNIYTHGEMLPANAYPELKKHDHLVGNYGGSWWHQNEEFDAFGGPVLLTTNCLIPPKDSYIGRLYTTGQTGWPGVPHIADRKDGKQKDFSAIIAQAKSLNVTPKELENGAIPIGFAHASVLAVADKVIEAIQAGALKRFVVMAGCDGRHKSRDYFTQLAEALPKDSIILTAGCAKYRYNKLDLGDIGGIPRVLDAGQCNDSYSLVVIALKLAEALGIEDINELPIEYDIAWYEQKAVLVLLALLSLGVKKIRLGPTLPAFLSPKVAKVIVDTFDLRPTATLEEDLASIVAGN